MNYRALRLLGSQVVLVATLGFLLDACGDKPKPVTRDVQAWRKLGSWTGRGPISTEPLISDTGTLRLQWETRNEAAPGKGVFQITGIPQLRDSRVIAAGVPRSSCYI